MRACAAALVAVALAGCAGEAVDPTKRQGGAEFREVRATAAVVPVEGLYRVCWPQGSSPKQRVTLIFEPGGAVGFQAEEGASNSTARCLREIAASWPWKPRPTEPVVVTPPVSPPTGFEALAWVGLLSPSRYGPARGLADPAPLVRACLEEAGAVREATRFEVVHTPAYGVHVPGGVLTDAERCIEAVLGSTVWPSTRDMVLDFGSRKGAPPAAGNVLLYRTPQAPSPGALDPQRVSESIKLQQKAVGLCWEEALARRAGIGGGRTFRFRTDDTGRPALVWVAGNASEAPAAADYVLDQCLGDVLKRTRIEGAGAGDGVYTWVFAAR